MARAHLPGQSTAARFGARRARLPRPPARKGARASGGDLKNSKTSELRRAEGLRRAGRADKALEVVRGLASSDPRDIGIRRMLADLLVESGNRDVGITHLVKLQEHLAAQGDLLGAISAGLRVV